MTVATRTQPDVTTDTPSEYKANIDASLQVDGEIAGQFAPHETATPAMTVTVDAGRLMYNGTLASQTAQTTGTITAPSVNPRIDRVVIDETDGSISVVTGAEAASPSAPAIPAGYLPCCQVLLATSTTSITNSMITDERILNLPSKLFLLDTPEVLVNNSTTVGSWTTVDSTTLNSANATHALLRFKSTATSSSTTISCLIHARKTGSGLPSDERTRVASDHNQVNTSATIYALASGDAIVSLDSNHDFDWIASGGTTHNTFVVLVGYYRN